MMMFVNSPQSTFTQSTVGHYNYVPNINLIRTSAYSIIYMYVPDSDIISFYAVELRLSKT